MTVLKPNDRFVYDDNQTYIDNFYRWFVANCIEREIYKEPKLKEEEAKDVFQKQWGYKKIQEVTYIN